MRAGTTRPGARAYTTITQPQISHETVTVTGSAGPSSRRRRGWPRRPGPPGPGFKLGTVPAGSLRLPVSDSDSDSDTGSEPKLPVLRPTGSASHGAVTVARQRRRPRRPRRGKLAAAAAAATVTRTSLQWQPGPAAAAGRHRTNLMIGPGAGPSSARPAAGPGSVSGAAGEGRGGIRRGSGSTTRARLCQVGPAAWPPRPQRPPSLSDPGGPDTTGAAIPASRVMPGRSRSESSGCGRRGIRRRSLTQ